MAIVWRLAAALLLLALAGPAFAKKKPAPAAPECAPVGVMAKRLMQERKLAYLADAIDKAERVHMWYVSRGGDWVELEVDDDRLEACIVNEGSDWHFAAAR
ncbi:MAG TPA: hypothetical protein VEF76_07630 [Patescibacteria group bacterium]|nr:hypothetical protein [Patescibacteria group bacterium]